MEAEELHMLYCDASGLLLLHRVTDIGVCAITECEATEYMGTVVDSGKAIVVTAHVLTDGIECTGCETVPQGVQSMLLSLYKVLLRIS